MILNIFFCFCAALDKVELLLTRCKDIIDHRIEGVLKEMMMVPLIELPGEQEESASIDQFTSRTMVYVFFFSFFFKKNESSFFTFSNNNRIRHKNS